MSLSKPSKVTYKTLTFAEKAAVIREVEKGLKKKSEIAKDFGIPANTLSTYLKNKDKILNNVANSDKCRKRAKGPENPDVDDCVFKWFKQARNNKIPISGPLIMAKAEEFSASLGKEKFKASTGWLDGFKKRNNISFKTVSGESGGVDQKAASDWKNNLVEWIQDRNAKDIFNVDETGLFYKCTPDKTLTLKNERCSGGKLSKERVTLLVGANMDGSEKLPLLMIGKSANPRCFKNVKSKPLQYEANRKAWMTSELFEKWLMELDKTFGKQNRTILLFIDNCTAHNSIPQLEHVKVLFFPPNMTSEVQPMDQGVIKNFKHFYRRLLVQNLLNGDFVDKNNKITINILQAARMCSSAWDQVTPITIANCFKKAGFQHITLERLQEIEDIIPVAEHWDDVTGESGVSYEDFVQMDNEVAVCGELTNADILSDVINSQTATAISSDEEDDVIEKPVPSICEAMNHIKELRCFVEGRQNVSDTIFQSLNKLEEFCLKEKINSRKQTKIDHFFTQQ